MPSLDLVLKAKVPKARGVRLKAKAHASKTQGALLDKNVGFHLKDIFFPNKLYKCINIGI